MDSHVTLGPQRLAEIFGQRASFYAPPAQARVRSQCSYQGVYSVTFGLSASLPFAHSCA